MFHSARHFSNEMCHLLLLLLSIPVFIFCFIQKWWMNHLNIQGTLPPCVFRWNKISKKNSSFDVTFCCVKGFCCFFAVEKITHSWNRRCVLYIRAGSGRIHCPYIIQRGFQSERLSLSHIVNSLPEFRILSTNIRTLAFQPFPSMRSFYSHTHT